MAENPSVYDVVVVGAGLAGLTAALHVQKAGRNVLVVERSERPGGLCGTRTLDGYEFVIGCNDFGAGMTRIMADLGVPVRFHPRRMRFVFERETYNVPPTAGTLVRALQHAPDILRLVRALRPSRGRPPRHEYLGPLVRNCVRSPEFADFVDSLSYPLGLATHDFRIEDLKASFSREYGYGYDRPCVPEGGPGVLVDRMCARLSALGGALRLGTTCERIERGEPLKRVVTDQGPFMARHVITCEGRWGCYPANARPGLALGMLHLALKKGFPFPKGVHTLCSFPRDVAGWLSKLDRGEMPPEFGFHCFPSPDLPRARDYLPVNICFYLPRGMAHPPPDVERRAAGYVLERAERLLPGLSSAILHRRFVSPRDYANLHGLSSTPTPRAARAGFQKPRAYEPVRDIYHVGNSVRPPGEHAGAAVLSGIQAAKAVLHASEAALAVAERSPG
jgi:phytoene dehydrogenase-like protein